MNILATPHNRASELALAIYGEVLDAVRADKLVEVAVQRMDDELFIQGTHIDLGHFDRVWIAGVGKASVPMASALAQILGDRLAGGLIITKAGHAAPIEKVEVLEAAHPVPDESSLIAGRRMLEFAKARDEKDLVLFVLSGGASALMECPIDGISLEHIQRTTQLLLDSGADIQAMNRIRGRISRIKSAGLADAFDSAHVVTLVLSDVVGNDLRAIGSGPLIGTRDSGPIDRFPKWAELPEAVRNALDQFPVFPKRGEPIRHYVIGSISLAIHAASDAAKRHGLEPLAYGDPMKGEAREMARKICRHASDRRIENSCMIFGGETTVHIRGSGLGGRCQEMALAAATPISKTEGVCFLAAGTDGTDGPTDAAGGIVDPGSLSRAASVGMSQRAALSQNDSYHFLRACGGLIKTGPTGSNVNDIALFVRCSGQVA